MDHQTGTEALEVNTEVDTPLILESRLGTPLLYESETELSETGDPTAFEEELPSVKTIVSQHVIENAGDDSKATSLNGSPIEPSNTLTLETEEKTVIDNEIMPVESSLVPPSVSENVSFVADHPNEGDVAKVPILAPHAKHKTHLPGLRVQLDVFSQSDSQTFHGPKPPKSADDALFRSRIQKRNHRPTKSVDVLQNLVNEQMRLRRQSLSPLDRRHTATSPPLSEGTDTSSLSPTSALSELAAFNGLGEIEQMSPLDIPLEPSVLETFESATKSIEDEPSEFEAYMQTVSLLPDFDVTPQVVTESSIVEKQDAPQNIPKVWIEEERVIAPRNSLRRSTSLSERRPTPPSSMRLSRSQSLTRRPAEHQQIILDATEWQKALLMPIVPAPILQDTFPNSLNSHAPPSSPKRILNRKPSHLSRSYTKEADVMEAVKIPESKPELQELEELPEQEPEQKPKLEQVKVKEEETHLKRTPSYERMANLLQKVAETKDLKTAPSLEAAVAAASTSSTTTPEKEKKASLRQFFRRPSVDLTDQSDSGSSNASSKKSWFSVWSRSDSETTATKRAPKKTLRKRVSSSFGVSMPNWQLQQQYRRAQMLCPEKLQGTDRVLFCLTHIKLSSAKKRLLWTQLLVSRMMFKLIENEQMAGTNLSSLLLGPEEAAAQVAVVKRTEKGDDGIRLFRRSPPEQGQFVKRPKKEEKEDKESDKGDNESVVSLPVIVKKRVKPLAPLIQFDEDPTPKVQEPEKKIVVKKTKKVKKRQSQHSLDTEELNRVAQELDNLNIKLSSTIAKRKQEEARKSALLAKQQELVKQASVSPMTTLSPMTTVSPLTADSGYQTSTKSDTVSTPRSIASTASITTNITTVVDPIPVTAVPVLPDEAALPPPLTLPLQSHLQVKLLTPEQRLQLKETYAQPDLDRLDICDAKLTHQGYLLRERIFREVLDVRENHDYENVYEESLYMLMKRLCQETEESSTSLSPKLISSRQEVSAPFVPANSEPRARPVSVYSMEQLVKIQETGRLPPTSFAEQQALLRQLNDVDKNVSDSKVVIIPAPASQPLLQVPLTTVQQRQSMPSPITQPLVQMQPAILQRQSMPYGPIIQRQAPMQRQPMSMPAQVPFQGHPHAAGHQRREQLKRSDSAGSVSSAHSIHDPLQRRLSNASVESFSSTHSTRRPVPQPGVAQYRAPSVVSVPEYGEYRAPYGHAYENGYAGGYVQQPLQGYPNGYVGYNGYPVPAVPGYNFPMAGYPSYNSMYNMAPSPNNMSPANIPYSANGSPYQNPQMAKSTPALLHRTPSLTPPSSSRRSQIINRPTMPSTQEEQPPSERHF